MTNLLLMYYNHDFCIRCRVFLLYSRRSVKLTGVSAELAAYFFMV